MVDDVITKKNRAHRAFCSFYTDSDPITSYMVSRLEVSKEDHILEPCAGDGVFVEKILSNPVSKQVKIDLIDLNPKATKGLRLKYSHDKRIKIFQLDTLVDISLDLMEEAGGKYNKIIGNPPYGAWQDIEKRLQLKKKYNDYAKETYTLFIRRSLNLLVKGGKLTFIVPDTFLALNHHTKLRKTLLTETTLEEILLIPSKYFPGVNFGYANLCIITFIKQPPKITHKLRMVSVKSSVEDLYEIAKKNYNVAEFNNLIPQIDILNSHNHRFLVGANDMVRDFINSTNLKLGDIANCVTGFYSGDNKKFLATTEKNVVRSEGFTVIDKKLIQENFLKEKKIIDGLTKREYIPILKGGQSTITKPTEWFVKWKKEDVEFYKKDKKARFQNPSYYFREGIGVPMVKSSKVRSFLLENRLFDQSIVGIFPKKEEYLPFLLLLLNSDVCSRLLKTINHTANNSANYLKQLPIIINPKALKSAAMILNDYKESGDLNIALKETNRLFNSLYRI